MFLIWVIAEMKVALFIQLNITYTVLPGFTGPLFYTGETTFIVRLKPQSDMPSFYLKFMHLVLLVFFKCLLSYCTLQGFHGSGIVEWRG